jgi:hypothetical protein
LLPLPVDDFDAVDRAAAALMNDDLTLAIQKNAPAASTETRASKTAVPRPRRRSFTTAFPSARNSRITAR